MALENTKTSGVILSGMRPTGPLHIGHLGVLENWRSLQEAYRCFFMIADWHALTTAYEDTSQLPKHIQAVALDWLSAGLDPTKASIFIQSHVKAHAELTLLLGMNVPLSWLERVPTYKDQIQQLGEMGKDINTYGFLGYPLLMAADILLYRANVVPVGEDQLPHLEFSRELARRFNHLYQTDLFPEPKAKLGKIPSLPGVDGRKMSKSYQNDIALSATEAEITQRVRQMITDPARIRKDDPGHPEVCVVFKYQGLFNQGASEEIETACRKGEIGCMQCKKMLAERLNEKLQPIRERRAYFEEHPMEVKEVLLEGQKKAQEAAEATMDLVRKAVHL